MVSTAIFVAGGAVRSAATMQVGSSRMQRSIGSRQSSLMSIHTAGHAAHLQLDRGLARCGILACPFLPGSRDHVQTPVAVKLRQHSPAVPSYTMRTGT